MEKPGVIIICGPTGVGKTSSAIEAARRFEGEIVGADSMQIYRFMDIGTAKPTPGERASVPHHMIDFLDPDEPFDAAMYADMADKKIREIQGRGALPFIVGGTGLYIKALIHGLFGQGRGDAAVRDRLRREAEELGADALHRRLAARDPEAAKRIHPNDSYRIIRALEVHETSGAAISTHHADHRFGARRHRSLKIGLAMDRPALYERIDRRVDAMLASGLQDEVRLLLRMGYAETLKSMQSIGYRHMAECIQGRTPWEEAIRTLKRDTRRYAKRQMTWFKADPEIKWTAPGDMETINGWVAEFLEKKA
ncbi:MAG: tRNA (adenosine(37)-N6)-dimethylallyltransferase MiaA [Desulfobacterales bacterium]|nr:tRNA (adenosine(37)-N6)-dimethylallyltransferase MiaA [Desulfobacterales bacterium]